MITSLSQLGFNIPCDALQVILETIFPASHVTAAKTQFSQLIASLLLANTI